MNTEGQLPCLQEPVVNPLHYNTFLPPQSMFFGGAVSKVFGRRPLTAIARLLFQANALQDL
jgi:hypothetical protein